MWAIYPSNLNSILKKCKSYLLPHTFVFTEVPEFVVVSSLISVIPVRAYQWQSHCQAVLPCIKMLLRMYVCTCHVLSRIVVSTDNKER